MLKNSVPFIFISYWTRLNSREYKVLINILIHCFILYGKKSLEHIYTIIIVDIVVIKW